MKKITQRIKRAAFLALASIGLISTNASAVGPDFSVITDGADFSTVGAALLAIGAVLALVFATRKGTRMVLGMIK